ncbi:MAG: UvrD-helicase domain-containing protein, partial [candidate division WOR-3 bacterium]
MSNKLTEEQKNVVDYSGCNLVVNAFAGSGKTTTGIEYLRKRGSEKKLYLCFNKSVQIEVQSKIKTLGIRNIDVLTAHSLAYRRLKISSEISPTIRAFDLVNFLGWKKTKRNFIKAKLAIDIFNYYCTSGLERIEEVNYLKDINPFIPIDSEVYEIITRESSIYDSALKIFNLMADGKFPMTHDFYLKLFQLSKPKLNYDIIFFD